MLDRAQSCDAVDLQGGMGWTGAAAGLRVVRAHAVFLTLHFATSGGRRAATSSWDLKRIVRSFESASAPSISIQMMRRRPANENSVEAKVAFQSLADAEAFASAADSRQVGVSSGSATATLAAHVQRGGSSDSVLGSALTCLGIGTDTKSEGRAGGERNACADTEARAARCFAARSPGQRPDTVFVHDVPRRYFGIPAAPLAAANSSAAAGMGEAATGADDASWNYGSPYGAPRGVGRVFLVFSG